MRASIRLVSFFLLTTSPLWTAAQQDIPVGAFRIHVSYNSIHDIALDGVNRVFAATAHGVQVIDRAIGETSTLSKATGLSGGTITDLVFDLDTKKLIITFSEGYVDILSDDRSLTQIDPASRSPISGPKKINEAAVLNKFAYLATDYGVVVIDLTSNRIKETWRDLGISGQQLAVHHCAVKSDSIFLSTPQGILAGRLTDNLQDFSKWKRYQLWPFASPVSGLAVWRDTIYAAVDEVGLFRLVNGTWMQAADVPVGQYRSLDASGGLLLSAGEAIFRFNDDGAAERVSSPLFGSPQFATSDSRGTLWIGDNESGLISGASGSYESYLPKCPSNAIVTRVIYDNGKVFAVGGRYDATGTAKQAGGAVDIFENGTWRTVSLPATNLVDVAWDESAQTLYAASYRNGLAVKKQDSDAIVFDETNSPLMQSPSPATGVLVTSIAKARDGIMTSNYGVVPSLHLYNKDQWTSYAVPVSAAAYGKRIVVDGNDNTWMIVDEDHGGGVIVLNHHDGKAKLLTTAAGEGALPGLPVHSLRLDRVGTMWIGTANGVAYIPNASTILQSPVDAIKPIEAGRFTLRDDDVTAIAVDGGNRKWFGTRRGVWLYSPSGEQSIASFTTSNSILPSDNILDIDINQQSGEVFIATERGLASCRAAATEPLAAPGPVKIFPNPVPPAFVGSVGIYGTPTDATVKITDVSGRLVWETKANGSSASWNLLDDRGRRVPTGIYIVFTVSHDGEQSEAGKLAVIN